MNALRHTACVLIAAASFLASPAYAAIMLTIAPASAECGDAVCSGQTATATVTLFSEPGNQVRFDVVSGAFGIESNDPANPLVATLTVPSGSVSGQARVILQANAAALSQPAQLRATDVATGEQQATQFAIVQVINGSVPFSVFPATATISGPNNVTCSSGVNVNYYVYGAMPPYSVTAIFPPNAVSILNAPLGKGGFFGFFTAVTNGTCADPVTITISDATGRETTANLVNVIASSPPGVPPQPVLPPELTPQVGLWWNPNESGSGYALDYSNGVLVVTIYSYQPDGSPQWYLASGPLSGYTFTSTLDKYTGGQCISCVYSGRPTLIGNDGVVTIIFTSPTSATMYLPGGRVTQIQPEL